LSKTRLFFLLLVALLIAARLCHLEILWAEETLPLAAAQQMHAGKTLYRDIWFDKPPFAPALHWALGARVGLVLRLAGALYALLACWIAWKFARELWTEAEAMWAAGLMGFFLIFDFPATAIPLATDLLMLAPHLAAVWLAWRRRPFWSGAVAGVAMLISPKALFVAAACALWNPAGVPLMAAGFAAVSGVAAAWLWSAGALGPYWDEVWKWGRVYAAAPFADSPIQNGLVRTLNWLGFHAALLVAGGWSLWGGPPGPRATPSSPSDRVLWLGWLLISFAAVAAGLRFFPRYYFQLLPVCILLAARGFTMLGRNGRAPVLLLLLIPAARFGPAYFTALRNHEWRDTAMDRDSRAAAARTRRLAKSGDTLFVWGFRPEIYVYTQLPAATMYLDSQPLTGVPADRHLTQSEPVETDAARGRRAELAHSHPTFVLDGLGTYNPQLAIASYPDLRDWFAGYREAGRTAQTVIYRRHIAADATTDAPAR
jgi:hypothetical protein